MKWDKLRFQIHLSTAVAMMFAAGGLMWANVSGLVIRVEFQSPPPFNWVIHKNFGWPFAAVTDVSFLAKSQHGADSIAIPGQSEWEFLVVVDILIACALLFAVWYLSERWIRYRTTDKNLKNDNPTMAKSPFKG